MRTQKSIYKIINPKSKGDKRPICICFNKDCNRKFRLNKKCLVCQTCNKTYCSKSECWNDANDEYFSWETDGTPRGEHKELLINMCDWCQFNEDFN